MKIGFHNFYEIFHSNRMFEDPSSPIGDDLMYPFIYLRKYFEDRGHEVVTIDMAPLDSFDAIVFLEHPGVTNHYFKRLKKEHTKTPLYLVLVEPDTIRPANWKRKNHKDFKKIFSWNTSIADGDKYIWLNWPTKMIFDENNFGKKSKFCTLIASNKFSNIKNELYSERRKAIIWFEKNCLDKFDLYGVGWDRIYIESMGRLNFILDRFYRSMRYIPKIKKYSSYRGPIRNKRDVLKQYKFAICYENAIADGWVTEKIFDCFLAGVIPIYLGAPDISNLLPKDIFIDRRAFNSYRELTDYLEGMSEKQYEEYLLNIRAFLLSNKIDPWTPNHYAQVLERELVGSLSVG